MSPEDSTAAAYRRVTLVENIVLSPGTYVLRFDACEFLNGAKPGQFVMVRSDRWGTDPLLPRAFSLLDVQDGRADILIKTCGKASAKLEGALPGEVFSFLGPLGNTFLEPSVSRVDWLVAGGVGLAPLYMQAKRADSTSGAPKSRLFYGGQSKSDLVMLDELVSFGATLELTTVDGTLGLEGYVTRAVEDALSKHEGASPTLMACGPDPMLEAVANLAHRHGLATFLSLEGEMACGVGACLVCAVPCRTKPFRYTCVEGPVFDLKELAGRYAEVGMA